MAEGIEIKICGITLLEDAQKALILGADYIGFVFYEKSRRFIPPEQVKKFLDKLDMPFRAVGVFVNSDLRYIQEVIEYCKLYAVQLHGDEQPENYNSLKVPLWRTIKWTNDAWQPSLSKWTAHRYVIDTFVEGIYGGSGIPSDWEKASELSRLYPVILAGGLNPFNVVEAIKIVKPVGVDVSSGVEISPGVKDIEKMQLFIKRVRNIK